MGTEESEYLEIDDDEEYHLQQIPTEVTQYLSLANSAAILSLNGLMSIVTESTEGLRSFLLAKSAKNVRFASLGAKLGYYSGAYAASRSALEALQYVALFEKDPNEINKMFIYEFSKPPDKDGRDSQLKRAKSALLDLETERLVIKDGLYEFSQTANDFLHTSMLGLTKEFGFDIEYLVPDEFRVEFEKTGGDFKEAMSRFKLFDRFGTNILEAQAAESILEDEVLNIELAVRYDISIMKDLTMVIFFIAHRILDTTKDIFKIEDEDFKHKYKEWHHDIRKLGDFEPE